MKRIALLFALLCPIFAHGQEKIIYGAGSPTSQSPIPACTFSKVYVDTTSGTVWGASGYPCVWVQSSGGSGNIPSNLTVVGIGDSIMLGSTITHSAADTPACVTSTTDSTCGDIISQIIFQSALNGRVTVKHNYGIVGGKISDSAAGYAAGPHLLSPAVTGTPGLAFIGPGANDYAQGTGISGMETQIAALWATAKADGYKVAAETVFPRCESITYTVPVNDTVRVEYNKWVRAQQQSGAYDYLIDWDNFNPNCFDSNAFGDGTHPNVGEAYLIAKYMNSVLVTNGAVTHVGAINETLPGANAMLNFGSLSPRAVTGTNNTGGGGKALYQLTTGSNNTGIGFEAGQNLLTNSNNTLVGDGAGRVLQSDNNTAMGVNALLVQTSGTRNTAIGVSSYQSITTQNDDTALGYQTGLNNTGAQSVLIGSTTGATGSGDKQACVGYAACNSIGSGVGNTGLGWGVINTGGSGGGDTAIGNGALIHAGTGANNTAVGNNALPSNGYTGARDTGIGYNADVALAANDAAQIGNGTNNNSSTLQFMTQNFLDSSGNMSANLIKLPVGTAIASAATIAPLSGITHITGTTQITTITVPTIGVSGAAFTGCVVLIPDGLWTTATGGNIQLGSTAVVSKALTECYDGTKWYPSY